MEMLRIFAEYVIGPVLIAVLAKILHTTNKQHGEGQLKIAKNTETTELLQTLVVDMHDDVKELKTTAADVVVRLTEVETGLSSHVHEPETPNLRSVK